MYSNRNFSKVCRKLDFLVEMCVVKTYVVNICGNKKLAILMCFRRVFNFLGVKTLYVEGESESCRK